ncbi:MAG TPA: M23 family metallopeptidase, partial [Dehalococcoidia bacterium]|nr:M23 family metallopeptidase [Dehalococcoidia bacterium]
ASTFYPGPGADRAPTSGASGAAPAAAVSASATPAPTPSPTPSATPSATPQPAAAPSANVLALQQQVNVAQQTLDRMTAPPNPVAIQQAADKVAAAQGRLSDLQAARAAADAATPTPSPAPSATPAAPDALTPDQQLAQAQAQYGAAQQQLQALSRQPDPAAVKAAQDELTAAQQAWQALAAQADSGVVAQVTADPQAALRQYASSGITTTGPDPVPFAWPARGPISSLFGPSHPLGIDIAQGPGLPITAAASGVVTFSGGDACCSYGYYVDITHPGGYVTRYGHMLLPSYLKPGDHVRQGQIIGLSGSTGFATGPHVHFEIRLNGVPLDPLKLLAGALPRPLSP